MAVQTFRPRLWLTLGLSVLAPMAAAQVATPPAPACADGTLRGDSDLGEAGESGEGVGSEGDRRAVALARIVAQIAASDARRLAGDGETAAVLLMAAADAGPARLARAGGRSRELEAALAAVAEAPQDPDRRAAVHRRLDAMAAALPEMAEPLGRLRLSLRLVAEALSAYAAAVECDRIADRAAYAEASALAEEAAEMARAAAVPASDDAVTALRRVALLLPAGVPDVPPAVGLVSAAVSRALLDGSDFRPR